MTDLIDRLQLDADVCEQVALLLSDIPLSGHHKEAICGVAEDLREAITALEQLQDPGWKEFIAICHTWLEHYPPDVFDGSSSAPGSLFVVALRKALAALPEPPE